jgi:hypothetical protein
MLSRIHHDEREARDDHEESRLGFFAIVASLELFVVRA